MGSKNAHLRKTTFIVVGLSSSTLSDHESDEEGAESNDLDRVHDGKKIVECYLVKREEEGESASLGVCF